MGGGLKESLKDAFSIESIVKTLAPKVIVWGAAGAVAVIVTVGVWLGPLRGALVGLLILVSLGVFLWAKRRRRPTPQTAEATESSGQYEAYNYADDRGVILALRCTTSPNRRPEGWRVRVSDPERPQEWEATMTLAAAGRSEKESPSGELRLRFPDDFDGLPGHLPSGWYLVEWAYPMTSLRTGEILPGTEQVFAKEMFYLPKGVEAPLTREPSPATRIQHEGTCSGARIEVDQTEKPCGEPALVTRCLGCGGQVVDSLWHPPDEPGLPTWTAWHSEENPEDFGLRGVNLYVRSLDGRKQPVYLCEVAAPDGSIAKADLTKNVFLWASLYEDGVTIDSSGVEISEVDSLHFLYPSKAKFRNAPSTPLDDGIYRIRWKTLGPAGGRVLREDLFEVSDGRLIR